ncbi:hypothetical protein RUM44_004235 [Polyplax serrata]|uniref:Ankyrin repeat domain-containing protein 50 n=1 Tax=Polyplax serrata TaxID=468196 RepID=A0ABR1B2N4_POLSC
MAGPCHDRRKFYCREWAFQKLAHCLEQRPASKTCGAFIVGGPGSGKTSFCSEIVWPGNGDCNRQQRALRRRLLAYHFCQAHKVSSLSVSDFVRSLVSQVLGKGSEVLTSPTSSEIASLTVSCRTVSEQYSEKVRHDPEIQAALKPDFLDHEPDEALKKGFLFPLLEIDPPKHCLFLLIDSIDENQIQSPNLSQLHPEVKSGNGSKTIAELLANHHHLFPQWLLLVCTARRQSKHISRMFTGFRKLSLDDLRKSQVVRDVQQYILARIDSEESLRRHISRDTAEMLNQLHIKSNGCFLYLEKVLDGVSENFIILREIREIPGTINGLYLWLCQRLFHRKHFAKVQPLLNVILASRKPLTISEIFDAVWTSNTQMTRPEFNKRLHLLRRVVRLNSDGTVLLFHHSFGEWLLDAKYCTKKYLCSAEQGHGMLAMSHSLKAKQLDSEDIQNFALHLTRMPPPEDSVLNFVEGTLNFDYNTILVLWLIQSGANVENCLLGQDKKDELVSYLRDQGVGSKKKQPQEVIRKRSNSLIKKDQRSKLTKYDSYDGKKKLKSRKHSSLKRNPSGQGSNLCQYEKLQECYEELQFEPCGLRDLDTEKRISEDYDHLDFDLKKPEKKTITAETNELLQQLTNLDLRIKKNEAVFFEKEKSSEFLKELNDHSFKFSMGSPAKNNETNFLKLDSQDSGFLKSEDTSTLGVRSEGQATISSTNDEKNDYLAKVELTKEEELDLLLNGLEKSLNEESQLLENSFLSQITQNSLVALKQDDVEEKNSNKILIDRNGGNENLDSKSGRDSEPTVKKSEEPSQENEKGAAEEKKGLVIESLKEVLAVPKDPKVLKILTEAGAKVSNCNSLQRNEKSSASDDGKDFDSSQVSRSSPNTELKEFLQSWNKEADICSVDSVGRTTIHTLAGEGNATLLSLIISTYPETNLELEDRHGQTALNLAARHGYLDVVEVLLSAGAACNHSDCEGWTALRAAAWGGHTAVVELLLKNGADVDVADSDQRTALRAAAWGGHEDIVELLVTHNANVNQTDEDGRTALIAASYMGHSEIIEYLLDNGAEIDHQDADGRTALSVAALCVPNRGSVKVVNILLEKGAFVDHQDKDGMTPLLVAAFEGHRDVCELLLEFEADVDHADNSGRTPLWAAASMGHSTVVELLLFWGCYVDSIDNEGRTVLSVAAAQGNTDVVRQLLDRGLDEQHRDNSGWTPLHYAAFEGHIEVCEALLEAGAKVDEPDNDGKGPLMLAAQEGHGLLVEALLRLHGAPVDQRAHDGKTALRLAALEGHYDVVRILFNYGADVNIKDADGRSTLYILALENRLPMARYILEHGKADVESKDSEGRTPVHVSAWQGHCEMVSLLLSSGRADVNATDNENRTALHSASWQGHAPIVRLLLDHGAVPDHTCNQGATALGIAAQEGHEACVKALLHHGADPSHSDRCGRNAFRVAAKSGHCGVVKLLEEYACNMKYKIPAGEMTQLVVQHDTASAPTYSPIESPESTTHRQSLVSLSNRSNHSKSSSNFTNSTKSSHEQNTTAILNSQGSLSFTQQLQQCSRNNKARPTPKILSPLESEDASPIYASPPHSPLSDINSPCEEVKSQAIADMHFARDTHMRIILGNTRFDSGHQSSKPKRNGIVTNPALRLMSNVKNGLECAAERIQKTRQEVTRFNHSKVNSVNKSNGYHCKKETPL